VTNFASGNVSVIDISSGAVIDTIQVILRPIGIAITPDGQFAYVVDSYFGAVVVIALENNVVVNRIPVGSRPQLVAITPDGKLAYVTNYESNTVSVIDTTAQAVITILPVGQAPYGVAVTPDNRFTYVSNNLSKSVSIIDIISNTVINTVTVNDFSTVIAMRPRAEVQAVAFDIRPASCPNPLNVKSQGVLPAAVLGSGDFDVTQIDPITLSLEGVQILRWSYDDVATPYMDDIDEADAYACTDIGPDGYMDLTLKFDTQAIVEALGPLTDREVRTLMLTGELLDGTPITGEDVVVILNKSGGKK
jgi:YVTN family beta-propeller protein